jgi:heme exporter protein C
MVSLEKAQAKGKLLDQVLLFGGGGLLGLGLYLAFYVAPVLRPETYGGMPWWSQKIFYVHLPAAWGGLGGMLLVLIGSVAYLRTRDAAWDAFAVGAAEACFLYGTLVLTTGPLWARPSWNTYWKWEDPRLMSFLALWLVMAAYFVLRHYGGRGMQIRVAAAAMGIVGALSVPFVYYSVKLGRSLHPMLKTEEVDSRIRLTVWVCNFAFFFFFVFLMRWRQRLALQDEQIERLKREISEVHEGLHDRALGASSLRGGGAV